MFKQWSNSERAFAVGLVAAIVLGGLWMIGSYYVGDPNAQAGTQDDGEHDFKLADLVAQWTMAIGTLALFGLTRKTLIHSEKTAAAALKASSEALVQTTRSVDSQIAVERGRLRLTKCEIEHETTIAYAFTNIGRGLIFNRATILRVVWDGMDKTEPYEGSTIVVFTDFDPIKSGKGYQAFHLIPKILFDGEGAVKPFDLFLEITYETLGILRRYSLTRSYSSPRTWSGDCFSEIDIEVEGDPIVEMVRLVEEERKFRQHVIERAKQNARRS